MQNNKKTKDCPRYPGNPCRCPPPPSTLDHSGDEWLHMIGDTNRMWLQGDEPPGADTPGFMPIRYAEVGSGQERIERLH